jgi:phosphatidylinositol glycan class O
MKAWQFVFVFLVQLIGIYLFKDGYLLQRLDIPTVNHHSFSQPKFQKTVLIMIDALRFDFMKYYDIPSSETPHFMNKLMILDEKLRREPRNSLLLRGMSDPPTTTLQRLMAIVTGALPTLVDAGSNFHSALLNQDNIISQLLERNKTVTILGDDTWERLFPHSISPESQMMESFDVWDLHTVDRKVIEYLFPYLKRNEFDLLIAHFLGVDHAGHRYGPGHVAMGDKLVEMNQVLTRVFEMIDDETLLILMGDHGMDVKGDHGGDSFDEMNAGLFLYSKKPFIVPDKRLDRILEQTASMGKDYDVVSIKNGDRTVQQIDLVPTWAYLLGLPIPYGNLGSIIPEVTFNDDLLRAIYENGVQVKQYLDEYTAQRKDAKVYFAKHGAQFSKCYETKDMEASVESYLECSKYLRQVLFTARHIWTRFEPTLMIMGIIILLLASILGLCILYYDVRFQFFGLGLGLIGMWKPIVRSVYDDVEEALTVSLFHEVLFFSTLGVLLLTLLKIRYRISIPFKSLSETVSVIMFIMYLGSMGSDSFLIFEDAVLLHFLQLLNVLDMQVVLAVLVRLMSMITICRQDQGPYCVSTFYEVGGSTSTVYSVIVLLPCMLLVLYLHYRQTNRLVWCVLFVWLYWTIDTLHRWIPTPIETVAKVLVLVMFWFLYSITAVKSNEWFWLLFLVQKPMGSIALCLVYLAMVTNREKGNSIWIFLLGQLGFFNTGHQYALASIQYDVGFIGLMNANYVLSPLYVSLNTVGGPLLVFALLYSWDTRQKTDVDSKKVKHLRVYGLLVAWMWTISIATYFAYHFNRHSQSFRVWGPKFFFSALQYLFVYGCFVFFTLLEWIMSKIRL